jgi:N-acetylglucosamine malate deacetylase 1
VGYEREVRIGPGQRALAVGAHPDDAEFGCYGVLQRFAERQVLVLSSGEHGGPPDQRRQEASKAAELIGATLTVGTEPDTAISSRSAIAVIAEAIEEFQPDVVFCPSRQDDHQDHAAAAHATFVATRRWAGLLLAYYTPSAAATFLPQAVVGLTEAEWTSKLDALAIHESQSHRSYLADGYLDTTARYWALHGATGAEWAEPFEVVRWLQPALD